MSGQKGIKLQIMLDGEQQLHHIGLVGYYMTIHLSELWINRAKDIIIFYHRW